MPRSLLPIRLAAVTAVLALVGSLGVVLVASQPAFALATASLTLKNVAPTSSESDPLAPGDTLNYSINYDCSSALPGDDCFSAVVTDRLPTFTDIDGNLRQLEFISASGTGDWISLGVSGAEPDRIVTWNAVGSTDGNCGGGASEGLCPGDSGTLLLSLRVPLGIVPFTTDPQFVANQATIDLDGITDESDAGPACVPPTPDTANDACGSYINADPSVAAITKSGPSTALLNAAGTNPITYTIGICAVPATPLYTDYVVTDTLPPGATIVGVLPFGGTVVDPGMPSTVAVAGDPPVETITPGTGPTIEWVIDAANRPPVDGNGCFSIPFDVQYVNSAAGGDATNSIGESKTNVVSAVGSNNGGPSADIGPAQTTLTLDGPVTRFGPSKSTGGNYYVRNGDTVTYTLGARNTSDGEAVPFSTATLTDGPLPVLTGGQVALTQIDTGTWDGAVSSVTASIETSPDGTTWTQVSTAPNASLTSGLAGVRYVRWVFTSTGAAFIGSGWSATGQQLIGTIDGDVSSPQIAQNCVALDGTQSGVVQNRGTRCANVELESPQPHPTVAKTAPGALEPGNTITYTLASGNDADATGNLIDPQITDCVPFSSHLVVSNVVIGTGWTVEAGPTPGACTAADGTTGTLLQFQYTGSLAPGASAPVITYDVTADSFQFPNVSDTPTPPGVYVNTAVSTDRDGAPFAHCVQEECRATHETIVPVVAQLRSIKLVQGDLDNDFNVAGTTSPGSQTEWKVEVLNVGNVPVENVQYIDIFPHLGDTGVRVTSQNRGTEFEPFLVEPIIAPAGWEIEYSTSSNPCRPEVLGPATGCDAPNWTDAPDLSKLPEYGSARLTFLGQIAIGDALQFSWETVSPVFDPTYDTPDTTSSRYDVLVDCTIPESSAPYPTGSPGNTTLVGSRIEASAWIDGNGDGIQQTAEGGPTCPRASNSFAYGVDVPAASIPPGVPDPGRLAAEPPKVDLHVAAVAATNSIGNFVWADTDNDGIQDAGEPGIRSVRVDLYQGGVFVDTTFTDPNGNYQFGGLPDGEYAVRFFMPDAFGYISPQDQSGAAADQVGAGANTDDDSDIPPTPTGSVGGVGNYYETTAVTLGNDPASSENDTSWDAGIWLPDPDVQVVKRVNGQDANSLPGPNIPRGNAVTWTYDVTNTGNTYLHDVMVVDDVTFGSASDPTPVCDWAGSSDGSTPAGVLSRAETVRCTASGTAIRGRYSNRATVTGTPTLDDGITDIVKTGVPTSVTDDDPAHYFGVEYDLALIKTAASAIVSPTGGIVWTVSVRNQGNVASGNYTVTDVIPFGLAFGSSSATVNTNVGRTLTFLRPSLAPGATSSFTITTSISDVNQRPFRNWAEISADSSATYSTTDFDSTPDSTVGDDDGAGTDLGDGPNDAVQNHDNLNFDSGIPTGFGGLDEDDNDFAQVDVDVEYDLALIKTADPTVVGQDGSIEWTITVANQGTVDSSDFQVTDQLPAGISFVSSVPAPTTNPSTGLYTWTIADLAPGATTTIIVETQVTDLNLRPFRNWAEISADSAGDYSIPGTAVSDDDSTPDSNIGSDTGAGVGTAPDDFVQNHDDITFDSGTPAGFGGPDEDDNDFAEVGSTPIYDLAVAKVPVAATVALGEQPEWRTRVYNQGNVRSGSVEVTDNLPTGLTFEAAAVLDSTGAPIVGSSCSDVDFTVTCSIPEIAVGDHVDVMITTSITGNDLSTAPWRNWAEISRDSAQSLYSVDDIDSIPDTDTGRDDVLPTNDVHEGVDAAGGTYSGNADPGVDEDDNDDAVVTTTSFYDLALVKVADAAMVEFDDLIEFTITVQNQGNLASGAYTITDLLPDGLLPVSYPSGVLAGDDGTITWTMGDLAPGASTTVTYTAVIDDITLRPFRNQAEISADSALTLYGITDVDSAPNVDPDDDGSYPPAGSPAGTGTDNVLISEAGNESEEDDADIADVDVDVVYDLALVKVVDASDLVANGPEVGIATFTITTQNQGTVPSRSFTITDTVPAGIEPMLPISDSGVWDSTDRTITWIVLDSMPGGTANREYVVTVSDITARGFRNVAEISSDSSSVYSTATVTVTDTDSTPDVNTVNDGTYPPLLSPPGTGIDNLDIAEAGLDNGDPQDDADIADLTYDVVYDLALIKVADAAVVNFADTIRFTITVQNQGNVDSGAYTVTDFVPDGLLPILPIPDGGVWDEAGGIIVWALGATDPEQLDPGASIELRYSAVIDDITERPFRNVAEITADGADEYDAPVAGIDIEDSDSTPDSDATNDGVYPPEVEFPTPGEGIDNLVASEAGTETGDVQDDADIADVGVTVVYDLQLIKTAGTPPSSYDDEIVYTLTVFNQGTVPSGDVTVTDWIPAGTSVADAGGGVYDAVDGTVTWIITDSIAVGGSASMVLSLTMDDFTQRPFRNVAEITADSADDFDTPTIDVEDVDSTPDSDPTDDVQVIDQTELQDGVGGFNDPTVDADDHDFDVTDFDVTYDLALIKTASPALVQPDGLVTYVIQVVNQGNVPANDFTVVDQLPAGLTLVEAVGATASDTTLTWTVDQLLPGEMRTLSFTMSIADLSLRPYRNIAEVATDSADDYDTPAEDISDVDSSPDDVIDNDGVYPAVGVAPGTGIDNVVIADAGAGTDEDDADIADTNVRVEYDIALVKILPPGQRYTLGDTVAFTIRVKNQGNVPSGEITFADVIPAGMSFGSASDGGVAVGNVITWTVDDLAPGQTVSVAVGLRLVDVTLAQYVNVAEIRSDSADDYDTATENVGDDDSRPDADVGNDPAVQTDDIDADRLPGDEDDQDSAVIPIEDLQEDNPSGVIPRTGSAVGDVLALASLLSAIGCVLLLLVGRRRRRLTTGC